LTPEDAFTEHSRQVLVVVGLNYTSSPLEYGSVALRFHRVDQETDSIEQLVVFQAMPDYCMMPDSNRCPGYDYFSVRRVPAGNYLLTAQFANNQLVTSFIGTKRGLFGNTEMDFSAKPSRLDAELFDLRPGAVNYIGTFTMHPELTAMAMPAHAGDGAKITDFMKQFPEVDAPIVLHRSAN